MKKFICIALLILILPFSAICLTGCKKDKDISQFYTTYTNIASKYKYLHVVETNNNYGLSPNLIKVDIDYSSTPLLESKVNDENSKYHYLESFYHTLLDDALTPLYIYGPKLNYIELEKSKTKSLFSKLEILDENFGNVSYYQNILNSSLQTSVDSKIHYAHLSNLFVEYEKLISSATELSMMISNIYFNNVTANKNPNYSNIDVDNITDADIASISLNTRIRIPYYKALYTEIYYQLHIRENNIPTKIIDSSIYIPENYSPQYFISNLDTSNINATENLRENKQALYNYAITLYNIQTQIDERYTYFNIAKQNVAYLKVSSSSNIEDRNYANIISQFANGIAYDSYEVLLQLTNLIF